MKMLRKDDSGVDPVIATLVLVLVAVAAGVAFYAWQSSWQEENTGKADDITTSNQLTLSGSSTVYEFTAVATPLFEEQYPSYEVSYSSGGSTSGKNAIGKGLVDLGCASSFMDSSYFDQYPDIDQNGEKDFGVELVEHTVAWDAVAPVVPDDSTHGLVDIDRPTMLLIFMVNGGLNPHTNSLVPNWNTTMLVDPSSVNLNDGVQWNEINTTIAGGTPCTGTGTIIIMDRADRGGTEEIFGEKLLGKPGGKKYLEDIPDYDITTYGGKSVEGNQDLIDSIADEPDALAFMSAGMAADSASGVNVIPFTISGTEGIEINAENVITGVYEVRRPINYITVGNPTGAAKLWLDFVTLPGVNQYICEQTGYVSPLKEG